MTQPTPDPYAPCTLREVAAWIPATDTQMAAIFGDTWQQVSLTRTEGLALAQHWSAHTARWHRGQHVLVVAGEYAGKRARVLYQHGLMTTVSGLDGNPRGKRGVMLSTYQLQRRDVGCDECGSDPAEPCRYDCSHSPSMPTRHAG